MPGTQQPPVPDLTPAPTPTTHQPHEQLTTLGAADAWHFSTGADVVVAVLDSGVDADHPDLAGRVLPGLDLVDGSTDGRDDPVGHGTTVASLVAGAGEPAVGLAPDATILPVRVLDEDNRYQEATTIADGVVWAVDEGADVINLSLGGPRESSALALALAYAMANDVVVVACTGNLSGDETYEVWYPAREPGVLAVAGIEFVGEESVAAGWRASLTGPETVLAAPAVVTGAEAGGGHRRVQGTSFASALVAAAAALLRSAYPEMPAAEVVHRLVTTADDLGQPARNPDYGYGVVDPVAALTAPSFEVPVNPLDTKARYGVAGFGSAPTDPWQLAGDPSPVPDAAATAVAAAPPGGRTSEAPAWLLLSAVALAATALGLAAAAAAQRSRSPRRS
ncbi:type VII secretion-associated serine protease mycosin [Natronosporangium hydrolyticum]|uniref:Type VII secretion-associated serine protease mycosin n=2 Tax=Natronosporangium hydrolyticum TaxID=2811111 RepID=A0A895YHZ4_9ACTN|nr:type VII secretion-associated serine protease mycosin [Natronosporangium hydrolyticum]